MIKTNDFNDLTYDQTTDINGGVGFVAGLAIGVVVAWVADGILIASTGKSGGEWVATGLAALEPSYAGYNSSGYRGSTSANGRTHSSAGYALY